MNEFELLVEPRNELGSRATRRLRRAGQVPAVLYGGGKDPVAISLNANEVKKQTQHEAFYSHVLTVKVGGESVQAVLKDMQRDPAKAFVTHMDLQRVVATQAIEMHVPVHFVNEDKCPGRKAGGVINHLANELVIHCLPRDLPEYIEVDVAGMEIGDSLHLADLALPAGVALRNQDLEQNPTVVSVTSAQRPPVEEGEEGYEEEVSAEVPTVSESDQDEEAQD